MKPKVGDLWRSTGTIHAGGRVIPPDTILIVTERQQGPAGGESRVLWGDGTGWISDHCMLWEPVNEQAEAPTVSVQPADHHGITG
jgi:hypothetical protein